MHKLSLRENSPRAPDELDRLLQVKQRQKEVEAMHTEDIQRLVTEEIETLKIVLYLVIGKEQELKLTR